MLDINTQTDAATRSELGLDLHGPGFQDGNEVIEDAVDYVLTKRGRAAK